MVFGSRGHLGANVTSHVRMVPGSEQEHALVHFTEVQTVQDQTEMLKTASHECAQVYINLFII